MILRYSFKINGERAYATVENTLVQKKNEIARIIVARAGAPYDKLDIISCFAP